jgi:hypothetical protein
MDIANARIHAGEMKKSDRFWNNQTWRIVVGYGERAI